MNRLSAPEVDKRRPGCTEVPIPPAPPRYFGNQIYFGPQLVRLPALFRAPPCG
jgi:hypothetical protein